MSYANVNMQGRLVNDPEIKTGKNGKKFVTFRLVVNQQFGEQESASFFSCTGNEQMAQRVEKAGLSKGSMIHLSGNLTLREYTDRENNQRLSADVGILDWHYVGGRAKSGETASAGTAAPAEERSAGSVQPEQYIGDPDDLPV